MSHKAWFAAVAHSDLPPPRGLLSIRAAEVAARERRCAVRRGRALRGLRTRPGQYLPAPGGARDQAPRRRCLRFRQRERRDADDLLPRPAAATFSSARQRREKDQPGYGYTVFRIAGNEAVLYVPQCDDQDKAMLAAASVEVNGQFECIIDRVADAPALFKRARSRRAGLQAGARVTVCEALRERPPTVRRLLRPALEHVLRRILPAPRWPGRAARRGRRRWHAPRRSDGSRRCRARHRPAAGCRTASVPSRWVLAARKASFGVRNSRQWWA